MTGLPPAGIDDALRLAPRPGGALEPDEPGIVTVRLVVALRPFTAVTAIELVPPAPGVRLKVSGVADIEKLGFPAAVGARALMRVGPLGVPQPVTRS